MVRLPQNVCSNQGSEGREDPVRIVGGLRRKALAFWCDGWCSQSISRRAVQLHVLPGVAFPPVGPGGLSSLPRYYTPLRRHLCPSRNPSLVARAPIPCLLLSVPGSAGHAPAHPYRITSSARIRSVGGNVILRACAVFMLRTNSNFVGCSTGRSAGLVPCRILSTYTAARLNRST
jgi:hypothetical protein